MIQKRNRFFMFICSLMPGACEMYIGFMKNGVSLMAVFFLSLMIPFSMYLNDIFICLVALVWFYSFFHAYHLSVMDDEMLREQPDIFIWEELFGEGKITISTMKAQRLLAYVMVLIGLSVLWSNLSHVLYSMIPDQDWDKYYRTIESIPQLAISIFMIYVGFRMIRGKKKQLDSMEAEGLPLVEDETDEW